MGDKIGALSPSIVAFLCAAGVFFCLAVIIVSACIIDLPNRAKRRADTGIMEPAGKRSLDLEISEAEKGNMDSSTEELSSTNQSTSYSSLRPTRPPSPNCTCEHPAPDAGLALSPTRL